MSKRTTVVVATLFGVIFSLQNELFSGLSQHGEITVPMRFDHMSLPRFFLVSIATAIVVYLALLVRSIYRMKRQDHFGANLSSVAIFIHLTIIGMTMLASGLTYLAYYYPGVIDNDTYWCLEDPIGNAAGHTIAYTSFIYLMIKVGLRIFVHANYAFAFASVVQLILYTAILLLAIYWIIRDTRKPWLGYLVGVFYALYPVVQGYAVYHSKDSLFSAFVALTTVMLYLVVRQPGYLNRYSFILSSIVAFVGMGLLRNNGRYAIIACLIITSFLIIKYRIRWLLTAFVSLLIILSPNQLLNYYYGIEQNFTESIAVPLQQLGSVMKNDGRVASAEREFLLDVASQETWNAYNPISVDNIKFSHGYNREFVNSHQGELIGVWAKVGRKNPGLYAQSYLALTSPLWHPKTQSAKHDEASIPRGLRKPPQWIIDNRPGDFWTELNSVTADNKLPKPLSSVVDKYYDVFNDSVNAGSWLWIYLFLAVLAFSQRNRHWFVAMLPLIMTSGTLFVAIPYAVPLRYAFHYVLCVPIALMILIQDGDQRNNNGDADCGAIEQSNSVRQ